MYNLTVDDAHTFFVGEQAWLVHNTCNINDFVLIDSTYFSKMGADVLPTSLNTPSYAFTAIGGYNIDGSLHRIALYDINGHLMAHIDAPHAPTPQYVNGELNPATVWHWHDLSELKPGDDLRSGIAEEHNIIGTTGSFNELETFLQKLGFSFDDWQSFDS
jgi:hypothetical protein